MQVDDLDALALTEIGWREEEPPGQSDDKRNPRKHECGTDHAVGDGQKAAGVGVIPE